MSLGALPAGCHPFSRPAVPSLPPDRESLSTPARLSRRDGGREMERERERERAGERRQSEGVSE